MAKIVSVSISRSISRALTDALMKCAPASRLADFETPIAETPIAETGAGRAATDLILREQEPIAECSEQPTPQLEE